jgi:predicted RNA binding protein YcfA (HicA-like mRNA interferase family)
MKPVSGKAFARILERRGWTIRRINGSHHIYGKEGSNRRLSVPVHGNKPLKAGLQAHLAKLAGLTAKDFLCLSGCFS